MPKTLDKEGLKKNEAMKQKFKDRYHDSFKKYERLGKIVRQDIIKLLEDECIDVVSVDYRIKTFESFWDKIRRKDYSDPLNEIKDICGLRIVSYYNSDIEKISSVIQKEFEILEIENKADILEADEFNYLSLHLIVKPNKKWLNAPSYRDLGDLNFEIQVRTILQHAWAAISHKLTYKKKQQIPKQFMRELNGLSAILENADGQFDILRAERNKYLSDITVKSDEGQFDITQELNIDTLQAFLDFYFPDRERDLKYLPTLLEQIMNYIKKGNDLSLERLLDAYNQSKECLTIREIVNSTEMDKLDVESMKIEDYEKFEKLSKNRYFNQIGALRNVLRCYLDDYDEFETEVDFLDLI